MKKISITAIVAVVVSMSVCLFAQAAARRDGRWEVKTEMSMPGMSMNMPPTTQTQCITKEEAQDPQKALAQGGPGQEKCTVSDYKSEGNKVTWKMTCGGGMSGTGEMVYKADTFEGVMNMEGQGHQMVMKSTGKRLGDCIK